MTRPDVDLIPEWIYRDLDAAHEALATAHALRAERRDLVGDDPAVTAQ
jgi:hypothetical protein